MRQPLCHNACSSKLYYPFGMVMFGRSYSATRGYRFGFNRKEKDNEIKGDGNSLDFEARLFDSRLGGWLGVDILSHKFPSFSPYLFCFDNPILFIDPTGAYPIITITKEVVGHTKQRVIGYTGSSKEQYTTVNLYKVTVTDNEDKNFKMTFIVTRDAFAVREGAAKDGKMTLSNVAFEPKYAIKNHYVAQEIQQGYPKGDGTKALKLTQNGSEVVYAEANNVSVELGYRTKADVASGVMLHVGGTYKHADGSTSVAASEGCFGITDGKSTDSNPSNDYSNKILSALLNQANKSKITKGKIEVVIDKRSPSQRTNTKTEKQQ